jgi:hypothetical protein
MGLNLSDVTVDKDAGEVDQGGTNDEPGKVGGEGVRISAEAARIMFAAVGIEEQVCNVLDHGQPAAGRVELVDAQASRGKESVVGVTCVWPRTHGRMQDSGWTQLPSADMACFGYGSGNRSP